MNNKISNTKVEVPTGVKLNDKDYMNSLLSCLKEMIKNYAVALTEASNEYLYNEYKRIFDECCNLQREVYEEMFRHGWYSLEKADQTKIDSKFQMLNKEFMDLSA